MDVCGLGGGGGTLHVSHFERTELGEHKQQAGQHIGADAGFAPVGVPVVFGCDLGHLLFELAGFRRIRVSGLMAAVQQREGIGNAGDEGAHGKAICVHVDASPAPLAKVLIEAVGLVKRERELLDRNSEPDMAQVVDRGHSVMGDLIDVEGEFRLYMLAPALGVGHHRAVFHAKHGKLDGNGEVDGFSMAHRVADVMRKRAHGEGQLIGILGIAQQVHDEVAGAHVVGEVGVGDVAEGVVADVLNHAPAIGVGPRLVQLRRGQAGIAAEQQRHDGVLPGEVDQLLMGQHGVGMGLGTPGQPKCEQDQNKFQESLQMVEPSL